MSRRRVRLGAVEYLNARPLVYGIEHHVHRFSVRFDVPSECARQLHGGAIDLGVIPSIEFLRGEPYLGVPGIAIGSDGPVASVAVFSTRPIDQVRTLALDTNSRTSIALLSILCARYFGIRPAMIERSIEPVSGLVGCDAALVIGDRALWFDHDRAGVQKIDLGAAWTAYTGLPFVYAFWAGRPGALASEDAAVLAELGRRGAASPEAVALAHYPADPVRAATGASYLRDNVKYGFGDRQLAGLARFYREAADLGLVPSYREPRFY